MAEVFVVIQPALPVAPHERRARLMLAIGDQIQVTSTLSMSVERRECGLEQVWRVGGREHSGPISQVAHVRTGDINRIVCRAVSESRCLLEVEFFDCSGTRRCTVVRAAA